MAKESLLYMSPAGSPLLVRRSHRAMILLDADDDGASDVLLVPVDGRAVLLHNDCPTPKEGGPARVRIELRGSNKNTEALGARRDRRRRWQVFRAIRASRRLLRELARSAATA